jgi:hypothetical protein
MMAPAVMALRWPTLVAEAMSHSGTRPETRRAVTEKMVAAAEGAVAMQMSLATAGFRAWTGLLAGRIEQNSLGKAHSAAVDAALRPSAKRVSANLKRLTR